MNDITPHSSVAIFRLGCLRVMSLWAHEWLTLHYNKDPKDIQRWVQNVQLAYFDVLKRNPTVEEWVHDVLYASSFDAPKDVLKAVLVARQLRPDANLLVMKPYFVRYHAAKRDIRAALQKFSRDVGEAFMEMQYRRRVMPLDPEQDWADAETIRAFIQEVKTPTRRWTRFKRWWDHFLTH